MNAPVIVENSGGRRPCDLLLQQHFGAHHVDEYQVNTVNASHPRTIGRALMRMGHKVEFANGIYGGYQAIGWDEKNKVYIGASEGRKDGQAAGY